MSMTFRDVDVAAMLHLAGEVTELENDLHVRRRHILDGLVRLVGACGGACSEIEPEQFNTGWSVPGTVTLAGTFDHDRSFIERYLIGCVGALDPCTPFLLRCAGSTITFRRSDVMDRSWYRSEHFDRLRRPRGIGESLYASFLAPDGRRVKVTLARELHDSPFTEHEAQLLHMFHQNLSSLYFSAEPSACATDRPSNPGDRVASLPPRLRPVLRQLLAGDAEKQVAHKLGLSAHTVHAYTKALYRTFNVNSRGELLAQFVVTQ
jgi:DNA-binding CsgD family transcriptional regulator